MATILFRFAYSLFMVALLCFPCIAKEASPPESQGEMDSQLPLWEAGVMALAVRMPHYRGADEYQNYLLPLPYFVYRGEVVKADREGVRTIFFKTGRFETDISLSGNPPVSDDNEARQGMEDLDGLIEIGPALRYYFYQLGERDSLYLQANLRAALSFDFSDGLDVSHEGNLAEVTMVYKNSILLRRQRSRFHLSCGVQFADARLHSYFYEVPAGFATPSRPRYEAEGGYGGFYLSGSLVRELTPRFRIGLYGRWINSEGAVFEDSPLVRTTNNYVMATFFIWKLGQSTRPGR